MPAKYGQPFGGGTTLGGSTYATPMWSPDANTQARQSAQGHPQPGQVYQGPTGGQTGLADQQTIPGTGYLRGAAGEWENALGALASKFQQPINNPDFQPMVDQLRQYITQLNGPAYTPAQSELIQTQATQPLEEQRAALKQQAIQRLAQHGINPGSGVVEKALENIDQQFNQLRTQSQAGFATNAINLERQNQAQGAQVAQTLSGLQNNQAQGNLQNGLQGVNLLRQIPDYINGQTNQAMNWLQQYNPAANNPYNLNQQNQNQNNGNYQAWLQQIGQAIALMTRQSPQGTGQ